MIEFKYINHACFMLTTDSDAIVFDPFLEGNPTGVKAADIKVSHVLVSHHHADHLGSAYEIAKNNNATYISTAEMCHEAEENGISTYAMHIGGTHEFPFGKVRITPAWHGAGISGGLACGFIVNFHGVTVYFAGDTGLFGDMQLLGRLEKIDYAVLPIGDAFTMGPEDAKVAVELLGAKKIIPVHYNTWPKIAQDPEKFKEAVEAEGKAQVFVVEPGETLDLI